jgi:hypothetical protein
MKVNDIRQVIDKAWLAGVDKTYPGADTVFIYLPGDVCMEVIGLSIEFDRDGRPVEVRIEGSGVDLGTEKKAVIRDRNGRFTKRKN